MNRLFREPFGLKMDSSILTRRGGTDGNAPESPERLYGGIGMLAFWVPSFWEMLENVPNKIYKYRTVVRNRSVSKEMG